MTWMDAIRTRHSVRQYTDLEIPQEIAEKLQEEIDRCNTESGLRIRLFRNEPTAFDCAMAKYGNFKNCKNYLAIIGDADSDEICGYYGERVVLYAQMLGLNSCWVALTYNNKSVARLLQEDEKLKIVIALGYGQTQGVPHKSRPKEAFYQSDEPLPPWFERGIEAAMLAPTAVNQQKFYFIRNGNTVTARSHSGFYTKMDLGIVKYHFEIGAGKENFTWAK